jgi:glycosyltransferase involved in cell wall biosynthesis
MDISSPPLVGAASAALASEIPAGTRLAIVLSHPTQYYSPWFRWLRANTALKFRVFYLWDFGITVQRDPLFQTRFAWDVDLLSGYEYEVVPNTSAAPGTHHFSGLRNPTLTARLQAWHPTAVLLFGYAYESNLRTIAWARLHRVPLIFRGDSHLLGRARPSAATRWSLQLLYSQFRAVTYVGAANRDYFTTLGVPVRKLFFAPHAVDHALFDPARPEPRAEARRLRDQLGIAPDTRVLAYAGKLVAAKQPRELLEAFLARPAGNAALVFIGDGPEKSALIDLAKTARPGTVFFLPFANQTEMPARYLLADVFVLPSRGLYETWGLAVNEAMHMRVPCLVSDRVGCQRDLVTDGETGWAFRAEDPDHFRTQLARALSADLAPLRQNVAQRIAGYTYRQTTDGLLRALASLGQ